VGVTFAILSMTFFSSANIAINRGYDGKTRSAGVFLSIVITFLLSAAIWTYFGLREGWPPFNRDAVAWFALAGLLTMFFGRVFVYQSIQYLGAVRASAIKRLNPFFSVLLGVMLLGERVSGPMMLGMALICTSFAVLIHQSLKSAPEKVQHGVKHSRLDRIINLGYLYGPISAFAYALGYVARKQGLLIVPDAALGTMIGAMTGIFVYIIVSRFIKGYRDDLRKTFTVFNPWLLAAGIFSSLGQLSYFVSLTYIGISKIALITSMEVFATMFLSVAVFRSRVKMTTDVLVAGGLGVLGTAFVILY
jgi:drug/metabolite transporter (DMT)-like permease